MVLLPARLAALAERISPLDVQAMRTARARHEQLTKPSGSLGHLEDLAVQIAGITGHGLLRLGRKAVIVLAADHGVAVEGVSAYPQSVTAQMVRCFLEGGAAINVLAHRVGARVVVADLGVAADLPYQTGLIRKRIARGTRNMAEGPAMTRDQAMAAVVAGAEIVDAEVERGLDLVGTGEMGIGNTTASSALAAVLLGQPAVAVTGRGTGIDDRAWLRKVAVIDGAIAVNRPDPADPLDVLSKVGGYEIAGLVGVILGAAGHRVPVVLDGFISGAAALVAAKLCPRVRGYLIAGHRSTEVGHRLILDHLGLTPLLDLGLHLGEGTGAALAMHLIDDALAIQDKMATFADARVSQRSAGASGLINASHSLRRDRADDDPETFSDG